MIALAGAVIALLVSGCRFDRSALHWGATDGGADVVATPDGHVGDGVTDGATPDDGSPASDNACPLLGCDGTSPPRGWRLAPSNGLAAQMDAGSGDVALAAAASHGAVGRW